MDPDTTVRTTSRICDLLVEAGALAGAAGSPVIDVHAAERAAAALVLVRQDLLALRADASGDAADAADAVVAEVDQALAVLAAPQQFLRAG